MALVAYGKRLTRGAANRARTSSGFYARSRPHYDHRCHEGFPKQPRRVKIAHATLRKYKTFTKQLTAFADSRGYVMLDQFTSSDIDVFYGGWNLGARAKGKRLGTLRAFFRFCTNRKWLNENPVSTDIKPPVGANRVANKAPYTNEEPQRIIDAFDSRGEVDLVQRPRERYLHGRGRQGFHLGDGVDGLADFRRGPLQHEPPQRQRGFPAGKEERWRCIRIGDVFA